MSIRDSSTSTKTLSQSPSVEMKPSSLQVQFDTALSKLLELKYVTLSKENELILTKKGLVYLRSYLLSTTR